jgi:ferredoxin-thioredoxin reductase catalytic subunit
LTEKEKVLDRARKLVQRYVEISPYHLNPDPVVVENVVRGLAENMIKYGRWYCPCKEISGDGKQDLRNICPCSTHRQEIEEYDACECGLFVSENYLRRFQR